MTRLIDGTGIRLRECIRPRIQDLDFEQEKILVCDEKREKDLQGRNLEGGKEISKDRVGNAKQDVFRLKHA